MCLVHIFPLFAALRPSVPNAVDCFFPPLSDIQPSGFCSKLETSRYEDLFTLRGSWVAKISRQKSHLFVKKTTFLIGFRVALKVKRENIHIGSYHRIDIKRAAGARWQEPNENSKRFSAV